MTGPADPARLLLVCGSLQRVSMNRTVLGVVRREVADEAVVDEFDGLGAVAAFDPDADDPAPDAVTDWRRRLAATDLVLIASPEYAGSLPGALKNALDWIVGSAELYRKPVALISAGTSGGVHSRRALVQCLTWQGAHVVASLGIASPRTKVDASGAIVDADTLAAIATLARTLLGVRSMSAEDRMALVRRVVDDAGVDASHIAPFE